jgi:hypothetical protein
MFQAGIKYLTLRGFKMKKLSTKDFATPTEAIESFRKEVHEYTGVASIKFLREPLKDFKRLLGASISEYTEGADLTKIDKHLERITTIIEKTKGSGTSPFYEVLDHLREMANIARSYEEGHPSKVERIPHQKFRYLGFRVESFNLSDNQIRTLLDAIDYVVSLFKKREMTEVIYEAINSIQLRGGLNDDIMGLWNQDTGILSLSYGSSVFDGGILHNFMHETLLHEIGHWVHLNYISREAKEFWDSGWGLINKKIKITLAERERYYEIFKEAKGDLKLVKKKCKGDDALKIHYLLKSHFKWLPLMKPTSFTLTESGKEQMELFRDPMQYALNLLAHWPNGTIELAIWVGEKRLRNDYFRLGENIDLEVQEDEKTISEMKKALGIPTEYGGTNETEDFAETFVYFIVNPEVLHPVARWRMGRTLGLSEATGKRVMRVAQRLEQNMREGLNTLHKRVARLEKKARSLVREAE